MNNDDKRIENLLQLINVSERRIILEKSNIDKYKSELKQLKNIKNRKIFTKFAKNLLKTKDSKKQIQNQLRKRSNLKREDEKNCDCCYYEKSIKNT